MEGDEHFAVSRKRRRSSLFVSRISRVFDEVDDVEEVTKNEPVPDSDMNSEESKNYIAKTKQSFKNWRIYEREIKSMLEAAQNAKPQTYDEKTLLEVLSMEDRAFLKEAEAFQTRQSELVLKMVKVRSDLEQLVGVYDFNKKLMDVVYNTLDEVRQTTAAKAVDAHQEMVALRFRDEIPISSDLPISTEGIFHYNSDSD